MSLNKIAISAVRGTSRDFKERLAEVLCVSTKTLYRYIQDNDDNLTKSAALSLISTELGVPADELLEPSVLQN